MYNITGILKVDIPLCDSMINIQITIVNTTKVWCSLKQHVSTWVIFRLNKCKTLQG